MDAERESLLARAFGPDADISRDPEAAARLDALLNAPGDAGTAEAPAPGPGAAPEPASAGLAGDAPASAAPGDAASDHPARTGRTRRRRVTLALVWLASLALTAVAASLVTAALLAPRQDFVAVLHQVPGATPSIDRQALPVRGEVTMFEPFLGVGITLGTQTNGTTCAAASTKTPSQSGVFMGCAPPGLPVVLEGAFPQSEFSRQLSESFPGASVVRFTVYEDWVGVQVAKATTIP